MFSPRGALARIPFLLAVTAVNTAAIAIWLATLFIQPKGAGHYVAIGLFALVHWLWFAAHARRLADAGKPVALAALAAGGLFVAFLLTYLVMAGLSATPEVQREAFRTGGSLDTTPETSMLVNAFGHFLLGWVGAAAGWFIAGAMVIGQMLLGGASWVFTMLCLLPRSRPGGPGPQLSAVPRFAFRRN
jgi:uncharacterized membrane protein YhaH (DUF805 family)